MTAHISAIGRLGADPETRQAGSSSVTTFSLATTEGFGDRENTTWWRVEVWGKRGEAAAKHLKKGKPVFVSGEPCVRRYDKQDGGVGYSPEIKNASWAFVPKSSEDSQQGGYGQKPAPSYGAQSSGYDHKSDLPF